MNCHVSPKGNKSDVIAKERGNPDINEHLRTYWAFFLPSTNVWTQIKTPWLSQESHFHQNRYKNLIIQVVLSASGTRKLSQSPFGVDVGPGLPDFKVA